MLQIIDQEAWQMTSVNVLRLLHKYKGRDMTLFLDLFQKEVLDEDNQPFMYMKKCEPEFFERITAILPMHIAFLDNEQMITTLEVLVRKDLGSERLFLHYIYLRLERQVLKFSVEQYCRCVRSLADKGYAEDRQFWHDYMFKFVTERARPKGAPREFTPHDARKVWDTLIYLKMKCPTIDLKNVIEQVEKWMPIAQPR